MDHIAVDVAALDEGAVGAEFEQAFGSAALAVDGFHRLTGQNLRLWRIRRDEAGARDQFRPDGADGALIDETIPGGGHHHGIDDARGKRRLRVKGFGDRLDELRRAEHAGLDRVGADIGEGDLDLAKYSVERDRPDTVDAFCVLHGDRSDGGHRMTAEHGDGLDVRLDAGAAAGIGAGDDEDAAGGVGHGQVFQAKFRLSAG